MLSHPADAKENDIKPRLWDHIFLCRCRHRETTVPSCPDIPLRTDGQCRDGELFFLCLIFVVFSVLLTLRTRSRDGVSESKCK